MDECLSSNEINVDEISVDIMNVDKMAWRRNSQYGGLIESKIFAILKECLSLLQLFKICLCHNQVRNT
jgi:hypothetical protein